MESIKKKLLITGLSLTVSVVMMVTASLAWMTISTKPEISGIQVSLYTKQTILSSADNRNYVQYLNISENFKNLAPLRPTSTVDGKNWFIPTYHEEVLNPTPDNTYDGTLKAASEFDLDSTLYYANVSLVGENKRPLEGEALRAAINRGYYVYTDFWLKTEEPACNVRLSVPSKVEDSEKKDLVGSYVLAGPEQMEKADGFMSEREAESCVRVGFLFEQEDPVTKVKTEKFVIYEPNADQRSSAKKPDEEGHVYVHGYDFDQTTYYDGNYIETQPIGLKNGVGTVQRIPSGNVLIQKTSSWKVTEAEAAFEDGKVPTSENIHTFGKFISSATVTEKYEPNKTTVIEKTQLTKENVASDVILQLKENQPVKIRLFIWLEGQDADCWNDIAAGSFIVNLELAGETVDTVE